MIGNASKRTPCGRRQSACVVAGDEQHDKKLHLCGQPLKSCERFMPKTFKLDHRVRWRDVRATVLRDLVAKHGRGNCGVESAAFFFVAEVKP